MANEGLLQFDWPDTGLETFTANLLVGSDSSTRQAGIAFSDAGHLGRYVNTTSITTILAGDTIKIYLAGAWKMTDVFQPDVNVALISGDSVAADNLEATFDGTGYNNPEAPAKQSQLSSIANVGAAINIVVSEDNTAEAIKSISFVGNQTNTYTSAQAADGTNHQIDDASNDIDIVYGFDVGGDAIPTQLNILGFLNRNTDDLIVEAYDFVAAGWVQIGTYSGKAGSTNDELSFPLFLNMVGTSIADLGKVYIRFRNTGGSAQFSLKTDHLFVSYAIITRSVGYALGAVWIDSTNGVAGTENFVNGVADNPVSNLADALIVAGNLNIHHFVVASGTTLTLVDASERQEYSGTGWILVLGSQSIEGSTFIGADVSGISSGAADFFDCHISSGSFSPCHFSRCGFIGIFTVGSAGTFSFDICHSMVAGTSAPIFDFNSSLNASNFNFRGYLGGVHIQNMGAGSGLYNMSLEGHGQLVLNSNCVGGTIAIRGHFTITDNVSGGFVAGGGVISDDARYDITQIDDTITANTTIANKAKQDLILEDIVDIKGTGFVKDTDSMKTIKDAVDGLSPVAPVNIEHSSEQIIRQGATAESTEGTIGRESDPTVGVTQVDRESTPDTDEGSVDTGLLTPTPNVTRESEPEVQGD